MPALQEFFIKPTQICRYVTLRSSYVLDLIFLFNKEHILISTRYQLYPDILVAMRMHTTKKGKKNYKQEKSRFSGQFLVAAPLTPPIQHQKSSFSKSDASKKETVHKHHRRPIIYLRFSPWRKSPLTKITSSTRTLSGTTN
jgi:hypothetical protein